MNPRFIWIIGSIRETYPDLPELDGGPDTVLWDRQENKAVATLHGEYGQTMCLEHTKDGAATAPLTALEDWLNGIGEGVLSSEGMPDTRAPYDTTLTPSQP